MDECVHGNVWICSALNSFTNAHTPPLSHPLSLSLYPCSTRKQNYMMNFARQTGARHYYSRKKRALLQRAWSRQQRDSHSDLPIMHRPAMLILFLLTTYHLVPTTCGFQSALDFPHPPLPTLCQNAGHQFSLRQSRPSQPYKVGRNETQKKGAKQPFCLFSWTVRVSSYFLIVAVVPLIPVSITKWPSLWLTSPSLPLPSPHPPFPTTLWNWEIIYHCWTDQPIGESPPISTEPPRGGPLHCRQPVHQEKDHDDDTDHWEE